MSKNFIFLRIFLLSKKAKNIYSRSKKNILIKKRVYISCTVCYPEQSATNINVFLFYYLKLPPGNRFPPQLSRTVPILISSHFII